VLILACIRGPSSAKRAGQRGDGQHQRSAPSWRSLETRCSSKSAPTPTVRSTTTDLVTPPAAGGAQSETPPRHGRRLSGPRCDRLTEDERRFVLNAMNFEPARRNPIRGPKTAPVNSNRRRLLCGDLRIGSQHRAADGGSACTLPTGPRCPRGPTHESELSDHTRIRLPTPYPSYGLKPQSPLCRSRGCRRPINDVLTRPSSGSAAPSST